MNMKNENILPEAINIDISVVKEKILYFRGKKVMLDRDLAMLYGVTTAQLNQSVRRNLTRFPPDFMFQLNSEEVRNWVSQFVIPNSNLKMSLRIPPLAFTEQGIAMLSSVLRSEKAIAVNIQIIRIFTKLRDMIDAYKELREKVEEMERTNNINFHEIFRIIRFLVKEDAKPKEKIGFDTDSNTDTPPDPVKIE